MLPASPLRVHPPCRGTSEQIAAPRLLSLGGILQRGLLGAASGPLGFSGPDPRLSSADVTHSPLPFSELAWEFAWEAGAQERRRVCEPRPPCLRGLREASETRPPCRGTAGGSVRAGAESPPRRLLRAFPPVPRGGGHDGGPGGSLGAAVVPGQVALFLSPSGMSSREAGARSRAAAGRRVTPLRNELLRGLVRGRAALTCQPRGEVPGLRPGGSASLPGRHRA